MRRWPEAAEAADVLFGTCSLCLRLRDCGRPKAPVACIMAAWTWTLRRRCVAGGQIHWILIGFSLDSHWILIGFSLDSCIDTCSFLKLLFFLVQVSRDLLHVAALNLLRKQH